MPVASKRVSWSFEGWTNQNALLPQPSPKQQTTNGLNPRNGGGRVAKAVALWQKRQKEFDFHYYQDPNSYMLQYRRDCSSVSGPKTHNGPIKESPKAVNVTEVIQTSAMTDPPENENESLVSPLKSTDICRNNKEPHLNDTNEPIYSNMSEMTGKDTIPYVLDDTNIIVDHSKRQKFESDHIIEVPVERIKIVNQVKPSLRASPLRLGTASIVSELPSHHTLRANDFGRRLSHVERRDLRQYTIEPVGSENSENLTLYRIKKSKSTAPSMNGERPSSRNSVMSNRTIPPRPPVPPKHFQRAKPSDSGKPPKDGLDPAFYGALYHKLIRLKQRQSREEQEEDQTYQRTLGDRHSVSEAELICHARRSGRRASYTNEKPPRNIKLVCLKRSESAMSHSRLPTMEHLPVVAPSPTCGVHGSQRWSRAPPPVSARPYATLRERPVSKLSSVEPRFPLAPVYYVHADRTASIASRATLTFNSTTTLRQIRQPSRMSTMEYRPLAPSPTCSIDDRNLLLPGRLTRRTQAMVAENSRSSSGLYRSNSCIYTFRKPLTGNA